MYQSFNNTILIITLLKLLLANGNNVENFNNYYSNTEETWTGKWFPEKKNLISSKKELFDSEHKIRMGIMNENCDNGMVNLTLDWDYSAVYYTCFENKKKYLPNYKVHPLYQCEHIPPGYKAAHECMDKKIVYNHPIPTFGTHRPLWPRYGEYTYVPKQRWIHNLEHGAIVMLYHPCALHNEVKLLKSIVQECLYRHVITPSLSLTADRPLALVAWGCRLLMSKVDTATVKDFITTRALRGPEKVSRDGQFSQKLIRLAAIVSTIDDEDLCPRK